MNLTFLIDECLSPDLAAAAHEAGYAATPLRDRDWLGLKDREVVQKALENDFVLVTRNARDFRGSGADGAGGLLRREGLHPGIVCLETEKTAFDVSTQLRLFKKALEELGADADLVNQALEITEEEDGAIRIDRYEIP